MIGMYDVHCHILPGVDDGAKTLEDSMRLITKEYQDGVRSIILTPHFRKRMFEPSQERIFNAYEALCNAVQGMDIQLYLGCEYHVNMNIVSDLKTGERSTMAGSRYALCEFSSGDNATFIKERCYHLISSGLIPILAHIERYPALTDDFDLIEELVDLGCHMQVNAGSILGDDGFRAKRFCKKLIKLDLLNFIGSDAHDMKERPPRLGDCAAYLEKKYGKEYARRILCDNPSMIVRK